jgi:fucose permease
MRQGERGFLRIGLAYLSFVSLGLPDGLLGIAWPSVRASFQLPLDALGALLVLFTAGYLLSSFSSGWLLKRLNVGTLLALSCLATALSLLGYALAPRWWCMVALGMLSGLGAGAIDAGLNTFAATHFSPRLVNWLHACYGIGASSGPVLMTRVLNMPRPWQWGYGIVGLGQLLLAASFVLTRGWWPAVHPTPGTASGHLPSSWSTLRLAVVWLSGAVFFVYTGLEAAAGTWAYSLFTEARGTSTMTAGMWVSVYWGALTIGRLLAGVVLHVVSVQRLLRLCLLHLALGAALLWLNFTSTCSFLGLALMGLSCAPIFPCLIATTPQRLGAAHTANGVGLQIAAAVLGQSLLPSLIGVLARQYSLEIVGPALLAMALGLLVLYEVLTAAGCRPIQEAPTLV